MDKFNRAALAALLSCSLMTPAYAVVNPTLIQVQNVPLLSSNAAMEQQCRDYVASLNQQFAMQARTFVRADVENVTYSVLWSTTPTSVVAIESTRVPAPGATISNASNFTMPGVAHLVRTGGSPNLFADNVIAHTATFSDTAVDQTETYNGEATYGFFCSPYERIDTPRTEERETQGECASRVAKLDTPVPGNFCHEQDANGVYINRLVIGTTGGGSIEQKVPGLSVGYPNGGQGIVSAGTLIGTQTVNNPHAGPATLNNVNVLVTALVCNNPGPKGGTWRGANGYSGFGCDTAAFGGAPTTSGNSFTMLPSNSLPSS